MAPITGHWVPVEGTNRRYEFVVPEGDNMATRINTNTVEATAESTPAATSLNPNPTRLKVNIRLSFDYGEARFTLPPGQIVPNAEDCKEFLDSATKRAAVARLIRQGFNLSQIVYRTASSTAAGTTITTQEWATAIAAVIAKRMNLPREAEAPVTSLFLDGSYLAMGDMLMKLVPVQAIQPKNPLPALRRKILDKAKADAEAIIETGNKTLRAVEEKITAKRRELERMNRDNPVPPAWVNDYQIPVRFRPDDRKWCIGLNLAFPILGFDYLRLNRDGSKTLFKWPVLSTDAHRSNRPPLQVKRMMWMPVSPNGEFNVTAGFADGGGYQLPHVSWSSSCQTPGQLPRRLSSMDDYHNLVAGLNTCFQRVALYSLLVGNPDAWGPDVCAYMTTEMYSFVRSYGGDISVIDRVPGHTHEDIPANHNDARETWRA